MAANIAGSTLHSFGQLNFKSKRGTVIKANSKDSELSSLAMQCHVVRFLFIDEVEAAGSEIIARLEEALRQHSSSQSRWCYKEDGITRRLFGGMNVCFLGDFWQLTPTGQIALMGNMFSTKALESAYAQFILGVFWKADHPDALQEWTHGVRVLELTVNVRSGADTWFSDVLAACRLGNMLEDDYNFLHGFPTTTKISFWWDKKDADDWTHVKWCEDRANSAPFNWSAKMKQAPLDLHGRKFECAICFAERKRRCRVINMREDDLEVAANKLNDVHFASSIYITPFNKAVFCYAGNRARKFAEASGEQLFWITATDTPQAWFSAGYDKQQLLAMQKRWAHYHARKTEGILSMLPACNNMPYTVMHSHGEEFKEYGVHKGSQGILVGWILDEEDSKALEDNEDGEVVLSLLPKILFLQMAKPLKKPYPGLPTELPANCFPMRPVSVWWMLDEAENIDIQRRGFPLVPNFSTTIHSATGRTLQTAIIDLADMYARASFDAAMRGYIALSRVRKAHDLLFAQPFNPALFRQGPQPFPTLLLSVLKGEVTLNKLDDEIVATQKNASTSTLLISLAWICSICSSSKGTADFVHFDPGNRLETKEWLRAVFEHVIKPGKLRCCKECSKLERSVGEAPTKILQCQYCEQIKTREAFSDNMWKNKTNIRYRTVCIECCNPPCSRTDCSRCKICRDPSCHELEKCTKAIWQPPQNLWRLYPSSFAEVQQWECTICSGSELHQCHVCKISKAKHEFPRTMWQNRTMWQSKSTQQHTVCFDCCYPQCKANACPRCTKCYRDICTSDVGCVEPVDAPQWHQRPQNLIEKESWLCESCASVCKICQRSRQKQHFSKKMWKIRSQQPKDLTCIDCCSPPCQADGCKTCKTCRDSTCKSRSKCTKPLFIPQPMPNDYAAVQTFLCSNCSWTTCVCGARMSMRMMQRKNKEKNKERYVCMTCAQKAVTEADRKKYKVYKKK